MKINQFSKMTLGLLLLQLALATSCVHKPEGERNPSGQACVATATTTCGSDISAPELNDQQAAVKNALLKLMSDKEQGQQLIKSLDSLMPEIATLSGENKLKPVLMIVAQKTFEMGKLPERITKDNLAETVDQLVTMIDNQFIAKGLSKKNPQTYISWLSASRRIENEAQKSAVVPRGPEGKSSFLDPRFIKELEAVAEAKFSPSREIELLVDGPRSFPVRRELIDNARKSVHVMSWAFEDDVTGWQFAKQLVAKHNAGLDVRIMVDNKTAQQAIYGKVPAWIKEQGVPIIQWKDPSAPMYAFHKKIMIVDSEHVVGGGMNFGDVYSHMGPEGAPKWRDTDFYASGNVAIDAEALFAKTWNSQIGKNKLSLAKMTASAKILKQKNQSSNSPLIMVIDQVPNALVKDPILTSIVKSIEGAAKEINIENAYFIENPAMQQALMRALKRGVQVRIFTNSGTSIDVPIIAKPILDSLRVFQRNGAEVYLKKGATLHSKFMTVDGIASWIMSYNHHPQSMRIQGENAFVILDANFAGTVTNQFQTDIATIADKVTDIQQLQVEKNLLDVILIHYFFDQL